MKRKTNKRNHTYQMGYTPNYNAFGQRAETHIIKIERETALEQIIEVLCLVEKGKGNIEFTLDCSCFIGHEDEYKEVFAKAQAFTAMIAKKNNLPFYTNDVKVA